MVLRAILALGLASVLGACGGATPSPSAPSATEAPSQPATTPQVELNILGASSLKGVLDKVKAAYETANPGTTFTISTDSSSALETKIEQGAPADVFLSADTKNPQALLDKGFATAPLVVFAGNELTIITPTDNPGGVASPKDLAKAGLRVVAAGDEVPITKYAGQLVTNLGALPGYPPGFAAAYAANVVSKEDNVKAEVAKIELGEGDAAIVYVTDAKASTNVKSVAIEPDTANVPATYAGLVVKASGHPAEAQAFLTWLAGLDGQAIFADFGFLRPPG